MTTLDTLGSIGLSDRIRANTAAPQQPGTIRGMGDDAAVFTRNDQELGLLATNMLLEGIHFDLTYVPLKHLGFKVVATSVSDIAAMNGLPTQVTVSIGLSSRFTLEAVDELYEGIRLACEAYGIDLVGGHTTASRAGLVIAISVLGNVPANQITYRNTAQPNDVLCVTGDLGGAFLGLQVLEREKAAWSADPDRKSVV